MIDEEKCQVIIPDDEAKECKKFAKKHTFKEITQQIKTIPEFTQDFLIYIYEKEKQYDETLLCSKILLADFFQVLGMHLIPTGIVITLLCIFKLPWWFNIICIALCLGGLIHMGKRIIDLNEIVNICHKDIVEYEGLSILFASVILFKHPETIEVMNTYFLPKEKLDGQDVIINHKDD